MCNESRWSIPVGDIGTGAHSQWPSGEIRLRMGAKSPQGGDTSNVDNLYVGNGTSNTVKLAPLIQ